MSAVPFNPVKIALGVVGLVLTAGTLYSILNATYLDTSDPLIAHLPHPLQSTHYFASKANPLNTVFIKKAWGWTSAAFVLLYATSPGRTRSWNRLLQYAIVTLAWLAFTGWFFGPPLMERVVVASGDFTTVDPWTARPRLRKGHDVSGHVFLLTMSILFLADQITHSLRSTTLWTTSHNLAVVANVVLVGIWIFATYTTALYFHTPFEKLTGFLLGVAAFGLTQLPSLNPSQPATASVPGNKDD